MDEQDGFSDQPDAQDEALNHLTDDQLEEELTVAAANPGLQDRYEALLAERERRRGLD